MHVYRLNLPRISIYSHIAAVTSKVGWNGSFHLFWVTDALNITADTKATYIYMFWMNRNRSKLLR